MCKKGILQFFWIFPCVHFTKGPPQYKGEKREIEINIGHQSLFVNFIDTPGFFEVIVVNILLQVTSENPKNIDQGDRSSSSSCLNFRQDQGSRAGYYH
jgi:hypothetical protein